MNIKLDDDKFTLKLSVGEQQLSEKDLAWREEAPSWVLEENPDAWKVFVGNHNGMDICAVFYPNQPMSSGPKAIGNPAVRQSMSIDAFFPSGMHVEPEKDTQ